MNKPSEKQLEAIRLIEKNLPYIKFVGATSREAFKFISDNMQKSREEYRKQPRGKPPVMHRQTRHYEPTTDARSKREKYEEYIEKIAPTYSDLCSDGWGGSTESAEIAKRLHPFHEWDEL